MSEQSAPDRVIGILGGMGPEATLDFYRHIINLTPASKDQDHIRVLIYSNPKIPDRTRAIAENGPSPLPELVETARTLERGGAGIIAIPCNTAHYFLEQIRKEVSIPVLDMVGETCLGLRRAYPDVRKVGLIAALGTVLSGVYHRALAPEGIEVLVPGEDEQKAVQEAIGQVKAGTSNRGTRETFQSTGKRLIDRGAGAVILGCTEVPLAFNPVEAGYPSLNSTRILAQAAVAWALRP